MRELQALQNDFQNYLLDKPNAIVDTVIDIQPVPAATRLNIYKDGYSLRLLEALAQDFEVLKVLIGGETFDEVAREYIADHPSHFRSIRWYGKEFSFFLQQKTDQPCLIEMAQFEWTLTEAFDAEDVDIISIEDMAVIAPKKWPMMRFKMHPSLRQLSLYSNAVAIWQAYHEDETILDLQDADTPAPWIVWRKQHDIHFCSLSPVEHYMLQTLLAGESFKTLCEGLCEWVDEDQAAMHAAVFLKRLIADELIAGVTTLQS